MSDDIAKPGEWKRRRRIIHATLIYCGAAVPVLTVWNPESILTQQTILALISLAGAVIGSYLFGAVWDDSNARKKS
jgi:zinc transporter ZupT